MGLNDIKVLMDSAKGLMKANAELIAENAKLREMLSTLGKKLDQVTGAAKRTEGVVKCLIAKDREARKPPRLRHR